MVYLPELMSMSSPAQSQIINFEGYSVAAFTDDGEMRDMLNLSSDKYPNLYQRPSRGFYRHAGMYVPRYPVPECMLVKNGKLAVITRERSASGAAFFYGYEVEEDGRYVPKGFPDVAIDVTKDHKMVAINTRICIWPEKIWFNVATGETGKLGQKFNRSATTAARTVVINNDTTTNCTVTLAGIADDGSNPYGRFVAGDAVDITMEMGGTGTDGQVYTFSTVIQAIESSAAANCVITFPADTFLTLLNGDTTRTYNGTTKTSFVMERYVPDLDYVMESGNRLWGCHDNAICCSKLGDPTNWHYYQGLSVDSYEVEVGTDGKWTGCCPYSSHLLFFKENYIHKVYGATPSSYQVLQAECYGLEAGSEKSIAIVNETVFYKGKIGIMAYSGTLPEHITSNFGNRQYSNAIGGTDGAKYYVSMEEDARIEEGSSTRSLFVFDLDKKLWHKEDDLHPVQFAYLTNDETNPDGGNKNQLLYLKADDEGNAQDFIYSVNPYIPLEEEDKLPWMAELGPFDEILENKKIYSKIKMRLKLEDKSEVTISIKFNDGEWQDIRHIYELDERSLFVPIAPVRCDKFYLRLKGTGRCTVESLVREFRERSDR